MLGGWLLWSEVWGWICAGGRCRASKACEKSFLPIRLSYSNLVNCLICNDLNFFTQKNSFPIF